MPQICDMGQTDLLPLKEGMLRIFSPEKSDGFGRVRTRDLGYHASGTQISNFMKVCPVRAELTHADERTDGHADRHDEADSRFSQFC
jgi:hypothetical protein